MTEDIELSVVVAASGCESTIQASLDAITASCAELPAEIVVSGDSGDSDLVPDLWAAGIARARGRVVALTTGHLVVDRAWARALTDALTRQDAGAGGPMDLMPDARVVDWAVFYLRYSPFLASGLRDGVVHGEIAGDNAAYHRDDLLRHLAANAGGFWEIEFHHRLRAEGRELRGVSRAIARLGPAYRAGTFARQRLAHGRHFSRERIRSGERTRLRILAAAPIVPFVMAMRSARRVWRDPDARHRRRFVRALPFLLIFAGAWAAGEASGALSWSTDAR